MVYEAADGYRLFFAYMQIFMMMQEKAIQIPCAVL